MRAQSQESWISGVYLSLTEVSVLVTNLWQKEGGAVVKVHVSLTVEAAPAVFQHVIHTEHVHGLVILEETILMTDVKTFKSLHQNREYSVVIVVQFSPAC